MAKRKKLTSGEGWSLESAADRDAPQEETSLPPNEQRLRIRVEKRPMGKVVTVVADLVLSKADRKDLAKELKRACGTGGTVQETSVELQGDCADRVWTWLEKHGWGC